MASLFWILPTKLFFKLWKLPSMSTLPDLFEALNESKIWAQIQTSARRLGLHCAFIVFHVLLSRSSSVRVCKQAYAALPPPTAALTSRCEKVVSSPAALITSPCEATGFARSQPWKSSFDLIHSLSWIYRHWGIAPVLETALPKLYWWTHFYGARYTVSYHPSLQDSLWGIDSNYNGNAHGHKGTSHSVQWWGRCILDNDGGLWHRGISHIRLWLHRRNLLGGSIYCRFGWQ